MNENQQILLMQIRLLRAVARKYSLSLKQAVEVFKSNDVLHFIREGFGIFHVEGDDAVLEDVEEYLRSKGGVEVEYVRR